MLMCQEGLHITVGGTFTAMIARPIGVFLLLCHRAFQMDEWPGEGGCLRGGMIESLQMDS